MTYIISPQASQDDLASKLRSKFPDAVVIEDGLLDDEDDVIEKHRDGSIKPFIVIWFHTPRRSHRGRSVASARLDQRKALADIVAVARSGTEARKLSNSIMDYIIGVKPKGSGVIVEADRQLWSDPRKIDISNRPSRWAVPYSIEWGLAHKKTN